METDIRHYIIRCLNPLTHQLKIRKRSFFHQFFYSLFSLYAKVQQILEKKVSYLYAKPKFKITRINSSARKKFSFSHPS